MRLACRLFGHRWVPVERLFNCMVCTRCRENGWQL